MTERIEQKKARRLQLMELLYETTDGSQLVAVHIDDLAQKLAWSSEEAEAVADYLRSEGLIKWGMGNQASITHQGVVEVEDALSYPNQPTEHFAAVNYVHIGGNVVGSQLQTGASGSSQRQEVTISSQREAIDAYLAEFRSVLGDQGFPDEIRPEAEAYLTAIDAQLELPQPNKTIVREGLRSLRAITENLAASGLFVGLVELGHQILF